jgi:hypothetical protein
MLAACYEASKKSQAHLIIWVWIQQLRSKLKFVSTKEKKLFRPRPRRQYLLWEVGQLRSADVDGLDSCNPDNKNKWHLPREKITTRPKAARLDALVALCVYHPADPGLEQLYRTEHNQNFRFLLMS